MSRAVLLSLDEGQMIAQCLKANVGVSAIEGLIGGGVRLVCRSSAGAAFTLVSSFDPLRTFATLRASAPG
jgi:hypothetical protein